MAVSEKNNTAQLVIVAVMSWVIPGGGYFYLKEYKRAVIILATVIITFCIGIYIGSIGVIDYIRSWPWYIAQIMNSPLITIIGSHTAGGTYMVYGRPNEIGQLYTGISGLLNLLAGVNAVYHAHLKQTGQEDQLC
jgi:hypothetical protein